MTDTSHLNCNMASERENVLKNSCVRREILHKMLHQLHPNISPRLTVGTTAPEHAVHQSHIHQWHTPPTNIVLVGKVGLTCVGRVHKQHRGRTPPYYTYIHKGFCGHNTIALLLIGIQAKKIMLNHEAER